MKDTDGLLALCVAELVTISHQLADIRMAGLEDVPNLDAVKSALEADSRIIKELVRITEQYIPDATLKELHGKD